MEFEWDNEKELLNVKKHGVSFTDAMSVFNDPLSLTAFDPDHSVAEDRYLTMGSSLNGELLLVCHTNRSDTIRIISARKVTRKERKDYEDGQFP